MSMIGSKAANAKDILVRTIIAGVLLLIIAVVVAVIFPKLQGTSTITLGDGVFHARVAKTDSARVKGLSGVDNLAADQALLMIFPAADKWQIWMKDMKVPLDIVWLNQDKKVVYIVKDASIEDGTNIVFTPKSEATYVLELPAGTVQRKTILVGAIAVFDDNVAQGVK